MKRREYIKWSLAGVAGFGHAQHAESNVLDAGPFAVSIPSEWTKTAIVEKVPLHPLYTASAWSQYQSNKLFHLKPAYECRPEHWAMRFPSALPSGISFDPKTAGEDETAPQILIHQAAQWNVCFTDGVHQTTTKKQLLRSMRKSMDDLLTKDEPDPSPAFMDASLTFKCLKRRIEFKGGHGVRLVGQWTIEPDLMRYECLHYLFLGMSDDDSCQIIATFPLNLEGLPSFEDKSHLGWSTNRYEELSKSFNRYENEATRWVESQVEKINPSLHELDAVMQSLVAPRWAE